MGLILLLKRHLLRLLKPVLQLLHLRLRHLIRTLRRLILLLRRLQRLIRFIFGLILIGTRYFLLVGLLFRLPLLLRFPILILFLSLLQVLLQLVGLVERVLVHFILGMLQLLHLLIHNGRIIVDLLLFLLEPHLGRKGRRCR